MHRLRMGLVAATSATAGALITLLILSAGGTFDRSKEASPPAGVVRITVPENPGKSEIAMTEALAPSIASVSTTGPMSSATGTALVLSTDGHLVTTADAIDGAQEIVVTFADGIASAATVVGVDADDDVAVIKVDRTDLVPVPVGNTRTLQLGARATVLSTAERPAGSSAVAVGLISGLGEQIQLGSHKAMHGLIETSIRLSSTESGAPLVDSSGAVIGLVTRRGQTEDDTATSTSTANDDDPADGGSTPDRETGRAKTDGGVTIRFAISIDWVRDIAQDIITQGRVDHVWLGIRGGELSDEQVASSGYDGALVTEVADASPASSAGIEAGDVIVSVDGDDVDSMSDLIVGIRDKDPGDEVVVELVRQGTEQQTKVTLTTRADG